MKFRPLRAVALAILTLATGLVHAKTIDLNLTGTESLGTTSSFAVDSSKHFEDWNLRLDSFTPVVVDNGDTLNVTITLDQPHIIPETVQMSLWSNTALVALVLYGDTPPAGGFQSSLQGAPAVTMSLFNGGMAIPHSIRTALTQADRSQFLASFLGFQFNEMPTTFDKITETYTIHSLDAPLTLLNAAVGVRIQISGAVPEPSTYALTLLGLALLGMAVRRHAPH